jgi:hypothetical protein
VTLRAVMVTIAVREPETPAAMLPEMPGFVHDAAPGLAVTPWYSGSGVWGWSVTHVASGLALPGKRHRPADALDVMRRVAPLADWTRPFEALATDRALYDAIRAEVGEEMHV